MNSFLFTIPDISSPPCHKWKTFILSHTHWLHKKMNEEENERTVTNHGFAENGKLQNALEIVKVRFAIFRRQQKRPIPHHHDVTSQWVGNITRRRVLFRQARKAERRIFTGDSRVKGIKILKILLLNILLFNKRVVQASTAAHAMYNVYEKGQIMWIMIFFSLLSSPTTFSTQFQSEKIYKLHKKLKSTAIEWNFHVLFIVWRLWKQ